MSLSISIFKQPLKWLAGSLVGLLVAVLALELLLQLLPVKTGLVRPEQLNGVLKRLTVNSWEPHSKFTSSTGWALYNVRHGETNNYGFIAPFDYQAGQEVLAVIGDSYIEAQMNDYWESVQGRLERRLGRPVYSFGYSGFSLADYLATAQFVAREFRPTELVIAVSTGDILGSTGTLAEGAYYVAGLSEAKGPRLERPFGDGEEARFRNLTKYSATLRYLWLNVQVQQQFARVKEWLAGGRRVNQSELSKVEKQRLVDFLLGEFSKLPLPAHKILFVVDGDRDSIYDAIPSKRNRIYSYFLAQARQRGFVAIDLEERFRQEYQIRGLRFDYSPRDGHWNFLGHQLVAGAVEPYLSKNRNRSPEG